MNKLKKYQKQIVTFITIFLLVTYGVFPALTAANTLLNILGFVGALLLLVWAGLELKEYVTSTEGGLVDKEELKEAETELDYVPKPKTNPKQFDGVKSDEPFVKTRKKNKSIVKIDFTDAKGMNEIAGVINPIAEGRVKISVENPKPKTKATRKPKTTKTK